MARTRRNAMLIEEAWQEIRTTQLINCLQDHALGEVEMTLSQVSAVSILLKKAVPDLTAVTQTLKNERPRAEIQFEAALRNVSLEDVELVRDAARRLSDAAKGGATGEQGGGGKEPRDKLH